MKKRFLIITIIVLGLFAFGGLSACDLRNGEHQHQFNSNWSFDAVYHWHAAVCEHRNEIDGKARHTFNGENRCTVCNYLLKTTNGLAYELNEDEASYTVSGYGSVKSTDIIIPSEYEGYPVTAIKERAFVGYSRLKNLIIPDSVTYVGDEAFVGCNNLVYNEYANAYYIGNENNLYSILVKAKDGSIPSCTIYDNTKFVCSEAFKNCVNLKNITIPETVKGFGTRVFAGSGLTQITIPDTFEYIDEGFFSGCADLKDVTLSPNVKTIRPYAFSDCKSLNAIDITDDIETVEGYAFYNSTIKNMKISGSEVDINERAFVDCQIDTADLSVSRLGLFDKNLINNLVIGGGDLENKLFEKCANLTTVTVKGDVNAIGESCFAGCTKLTEVTFEEGFTQLGKKAFDGCTALKNLTFPDTCSKIGEDAFVGCDALQYNPYGNGLYLGSTVNPYMILVKLTTKGVTSCTINDNATVFADMTFKDCLVLNSVVFGNSMTEIPEYMFSGCVSLTDLKIPDNIIRINSNAFDGCISLSKISLPDTLEYFGNNVFNGCKDLQYNTTGSSGNVQYLGNEENPYLVLIKAGPNTGRLVLNDGTKIIAQEACSGCSSLSIVDLTNVKCIGDKAFKGSSVPSITIPATVTSIGKEAFSGCTKLSAVNFDTKNLNELPESVFERCSALEKITLPENLKVIGSRAFYSCRLENITIPEGVTTIEDYAFGQNSRLTTVSLPSTLKTIGNAFSASYAIKAINYNGTREQWKMVDSNLEPRAESYLVFTGDKK